MKLFQKKKKKNILYLGYKDQINKSNMVKEEQGKMEKEKVNKAVIVPKIDSTIGHLQKNSTVTIFIGSLQGKMGCSYLAEALKNYLKSYKVAVVGVNEFNSIPELYKKNDFIILDFGNISKFDLSMKHEMDRANIKIMMCSIQENYITDLAKFIEAEEDTKKWRFLFNYVPENQKGKVSDLMEDYFYSCIPIFDLERTGKEMQKLFKTMLK